MSYSPVPSYSFLFLCPFSSKAASRPSHPYSILLSVSYSIPCLFNVSLFTNPLFSVSISLYLSLSLSLSPSPSPSLSLSVTLTSSYSLFFFRRNLPQIAQLWDFYLGLIYSDKLVNCTYSLLQVRLLQLLKKGTYDYLIQNVTCFSVRYYIQ